MAKKDIRHMIIVAYNCFVHFVHFLLTAAFMTDGANQIEERALDGASQFDVAKHLLQYLVNLRRISICVTYIGEHRFEVGHLRAFLSLVAQTLNHFVLSRRVPLILKVHLLIFILIFILTCHCTLCS